MSIRFVLASALSGVLYALLAPTSVASIEFWLSWGALWVLYAIAVRTLAHRSDRSTLAAIWLAALVCRGAALFGGSVETPDPGFFLQSSGPLGQLSLDPTARRALAVVADLGALALAPGLLRAAGVPVGAAVIHALNPLVIREISGEGRLDSVAMFSLLLAITLVQRGSTRLSALAYGASMTGPLFLTATLPALLRHLHGWLGLSAAVALASWWLAFPGAAWQELLGWPVGSFVGGSLLPVSATLAALFVTRNAALPLIGSALAWTLVALRRLRSEPAQLPRDALVLVGAFLFLSPEVLPWSFVPIAYLAAHSSNRGWLLFTATAPVTYWGFNGGSWNFWTGFVQYFPAYAGLIYFWLGGRPERSGRRSKKSARA